MKAVDLIKTINSINKSKYLSEYKAYAVNTDGKRGVAFVIENKSIKIDEKFNKVYIKDFIFNISGVEEHVIFLFTNEKELNEHYGALCLDFLNLEKREYIKSNPLSWFKEWRDLLGDSIKKKMIYDYIGEMAVILSLTKNNKNPVWNSITKGTFDISTNDAIYEVKSSICKSIDAVTIHNQFQLEIEGLDKKLFIVFVKLEDNNVGESIDSLSKKIVEAGFDEVILKDYLDSNGYYEGKTERYKKYLIHEIRLYQVDNDFPKITKESFKESKIPTGIIKYEYTVSLDGLQYTLLSLEGENNA